MAKCAAITRKGTACQGTPIDGSEWCYVHSPDYAEERRRHGSKGGKMGGRGRPRAEIPQVREQLQKLADDVLAGRVKSADGRAVAYILSIVLHSHTIEMQIQDNVVFAQELRALEEAIREDRQRSLLR